MNADAFSVHLTICLIIMHVHVFHSADQQRSRMTQCRTCITFTQSAEVHLPQYKPVRIPLTKKARNVSLCCVSVKKRTISCCVVT